MTTWVGDMLSTLKKTFILLVDQQIDTVTSDWNSLRDYCSETGKSGLVFLVETVIPYNGTMNDVVTSHRYFGEIK